MTDLDLDDWEREANKRLDATMEGPYSIILALIARVRELEAALREARDGLIKTDYYEPHTIARIDALLPEPKDKP